jgi:hypothetical protein
MSQLQQKQIDQTGTPYATQADFCQALEKDMKRLYLLAYLLTGNHNAAEQCFVATAEDCGCQTTVFKEYVHDWIRRGLVKNAIRFAARESATHGNQPGFSELFGPFDQAIESVTRLPLLDRLVYVLSILEGYSIRNCAILLKCSLEGTARARLSALQRISAPNPALIHEVYSSMRVAAISAA